MRVCGVVSSHQRQTTAVIDLYDHMASHILKELPELFRYARVCISPIGDIAHHVEQIIFVDPLVVAAFTSYRGVQNF